MSGFNTNEMMARRRTVEETLERARRRREELMDLSAQTQRRRAEVRARRDQARAQISVRRSLLNNTNRRAAAAILDAAFQVSGIGLEELWLDYFALGGDATPSRVGELLAGRAPLQKSDHDRLAVALNERLSDSGRGRPLAYWDGSR